MAQSMLVDSSLMEMTCPVALYKSSAKGLFFENPVFIGLMTVGATTLLRDAEGSKGQYVYLLRNRKGEGVGIRAS